MPTVKSTFVLDLESAEALERLARDWEVSKSAALRRAILVAATQGATIDRVALFRRLQRAAALSPGAARRWAGKARAERRATGRRLESHG